MWSLEQLREMRRKLHQIPELGFEEHKTQAQLLEWIRQLPDDRLVIETWRTAILVKVRGTNPTRLIGYRTDMDGLPISEETGLPFASTHEGRMHACGHDMHMTLSLGLLSHFVDNPVEDDLLFIFQPAEEGPGGAEPMLREALIGNWRPHLVFATHVAPEYPVGTVATRPGILFANTSELFIDLIGTQGHAAFPHRANDMAIAASQLVMQLQTIVARNIDPLDSGVITIGKMAVGTKQNIIAGRARIEGTLRAFSGDTMRAMKARIEALLRGLEAGFGCETHLDYGSMYRQVDNTPELTQSFLDWGRDSRVANVIESKAAMTGEDFGYFLENIPGFLVWLGVDTPYGLHHEKMSPSEDALDVGLRVWSEYIGQLARLQS